MTMMEITTIDLIGRYFLLIAIIIASLLAIEFKDLLAAIIASASVSLMLSLQFLMLHAPDVAMAEAAVGAGIMTIIFVIALAKTARMEEEMEGKERGGRIEER